MHRVLSKNPPDSGMSRICISTVSEIYDVTKEQDEEEDPQAAEWDEEQEKEVFDVDDLAEREHQSWGTGTCRSL